MKEAINIFNQYLEVDEKKIKRSNYVTSFFNQ